MNRFTGRLRALQPKGDWGHLKVSLARNGAQERGEDRKDFSVHRLVIEAFGYEGGGEVRHLNGIAWDNTVGNLCYGTSAENKQDALKHGTMSQRLAEGSFATFFNALVVSVVVEEPEVTYGLTVEEDHSHVTGGIVTHNTGRLSSSDPNLQNIPNPDMDKFKIRRAFTHEPGNILIVADYEQLEMRLLAAAAMEKDMIDIFLKGWDIHMGNASLVFGLPYEDIAAAKKIDKKVKEGSLPESEMTEYVHKCLDARQAAKAIGFGLNYGMGAKRLAATINRSEKEAEALIEQYMARYPTVRKFFEDATQTVVKYGYAFTLLGRRRFLPGIMSNRVADRSRAQRQASNMPIQGTAADVAKMAMIRCDEAGLFDQFGWHMLSQVHDELVFEGPEETAEEVKPIIKEMMEHSLPSDLAVPLTISIGKGHTWMDAK